MRPTKFLAASLLCGAATMAIIAAPAQAQSDGAATTQAAPADNDNVIIVTARRREERLLDVPVAVSAISGEELSQRGALDITDVGQVVPNVTLEASRATNSTLSAFIRGIGQQDPVSGLMKTLGSE